jgi:hypothetical protein
VDLKNGMVRLPSDVAHLHGYASMGAPPSDMDYGAASSAAPYIDVTDGGGWTFRAYADGRLQIMGGPSGVGTVYTPGSANYETVLQRLRERDPRVDSILSTVPQGSQQASSFISGLLNQLGVGAGTETAAAEAQAPTEAQAQQGQVGQMLQSLLSQYGPGAATALQTAFANRAQSLDALTVKVAKKRAQYASATKPVKKAKLAAEIAGLEAQIRRLQATQSAAQAQLQAPPPQARAALPAWLPWAVGGGLLLVGALALARK